MTKLMLLVAVAAIAVVPQAAEAKAGDVLVRVRAIMVAPQESSGGIKPTFPTEKVKVTDSFAPEVDVTYMASDHIGFELIAATTKHKVKGKTGTTGSIGKLASTWALPPTLTAQYHFAPDAKIRPYVGVGLNYTLFYSEKASNSLESAVGPTDVHLKSSLGPAVQAGVDFDLGHNVFINLDAKWIDIHTKARLDTFALGTERVKVHINPLVLGIGVGTKF